MLVWLFNSLAAVIRGTGNMVFPALVTVAGVPLLVPLSALLIFGWGPSAARPLPAMAPPRGWNTC